MNTTYSDLSFSGLDQQHNASDIAPGYGQQLDNLLVESGRLAVRPGAVAQFTSNLGNAVQPPVQVVQVDGSIHLWFASGTGLYRFVPGDTAPGAITLPGSMTLDAVNTVIRQAAGYVYVADNTAKGLLRFKADGTGGEAVSGLTTPDTPTGARLSSKSLWSNPGASGWVYNPLTTTGINIADTDRNGTNWSGENGGTPTGNTSANGSACMEIDNAGEQVISPRRVLTQCAATGAGGTIPDILRTCRVFVLLADCYIEDPADGTENIRAFVEVCETTTGAGAKQMFYSAVREIKQGVTEGRQIWVIDCRAFPHPILSTRFGFEN